MKNSPQTHRPTKRSGLSTQLGKPPATSKIKSAGSQSALATATGPQIGRDELGIPLRMGEVTAPSRDAADGFSSLSIYLRQATEVPLLTVPEEIELAARIKRGDSVAREHMIRANLRLVVKIARDYENLGLPLLDLINEGNLGLMKAVERFDPSKGGKLSTYGSWWIKQTIKRAIANQSKTIRLPIHLVDKLSKMRRTAVELRELLGGRDPTDEELAEEAQVSVRKVQLWNRAAMQVASLDEPLSEDSTQTLGDTIADQAQVTPHSALEAKGWLAMLSEILPTLENRELIILKERFGLDGGAGRTLDEIGAKFGVTRERIRQLQNGALAKLRQRIDEIETGGRSAIHA